MKNIALKVEPSEHKRLNYYMATPEGGQTIISKFIRDAIREKCEHLRNVRAGGLVITFPNPDFSAISEKGKAEILAILKEADLKLSRIAPGALDLSELISFYNYHFFKMSDKQRKIFEQNFERDLGFEAELDELEDAEFNEVQERGAKAFGDTEG